MTSFLGSRDAAAAAETACKGTQPSQVAHPTSVSKGSAGTKAMSLGGVSSRSLTPTPEVSRARLSVSPSAAATPFKQPRRLLGEPLHLGSFERGAGQADRSCQPEMSPLATLLEEHQVANELRPLWSRERPQLPSDEGRVGRAARRPRVNWDEFESHPEATELSFDTQKKPAFCGAAFGWEAPEGRYASRRQGGEQWAMGGSPHGNWVNQLRTGNEALQKSRLFQGAAGQPPNVQQHWQFFDSQAEQQSQPMPASPADLAVKRRWQFPTDEDRRTGLWSPEPPAAKRMQLSGLTGLLGTSQRAQPCPAKKPLARRLQLSNLTSGDCGRVVQSSADSLVAFSPPPMGPVTDANSTKLVPATQSCVDESQTMVAAPCVPFEVEVELEEQPEAASARSPRAAEGHELEEGDDAAGDAFESAFSFK